MYNVYFINIKNTLILFTNVKINFISHLLDAESWIKHDIKSYKRLDFISVVTY